jgi:hypothetical protein
MAAGSALEMLARHGDVLDLVGFLEDLHELGL